MKNADYSSIISLISLRLPEVKFPLLSQDDVGLLFATDSWLRAVPSLVLATHLLFEKVREMSSQHLFQQLFHTVATS